MTRSLLPLLVVLGVLLACGVSGRGYTYRGTAEIDTTRIQLDGYYYALEEFVGHYPEPNTRYLSLRYLMLWRDGTAVSNWPRSFMEGGWAATGPDLMTHVDSMVAAIQTDGSWGTNWGAFRFHGDTVSTQVLVPTSEGLSRSVANYNYTILSDTLLAAHADAPAATGPNRMRLFRFRPLADKPSSDNWTKTHPALQPR